LVIAFPEQHSNASTDWNGINLFCPTLYFIHPCPSLLPFPFPSRYLSIFYPFLLMSKTAKGMGENCPFLDFVDVHTARLKPVKWEKYKGELGDWVHRKKPFIRPSHGTELA
jgi:hypothetical protein